MPTKLTYCIHRPDRQGYWFDRRVPRDVQPIIGKKHWRLYAGSTIAEARRRIAQLLADTDQLIAQARSGKPLYVAAPTISRELDERLLQGRPEVVDEYISKHIPLPDHIEELLQLQPIKSTQPVLAADLVELGTRIKRPSLQTIEAWERVLNEFITITKVNRFDLITQKDCQLYRDHLLNKGLKTSTVSVRCAYLCGLLRLANEENLIASNPAVGLTKRLRADRKIEKSFDLTSADDLAKSLPGLQYLTYQLLRYSGCRLAEILGLRNEDINLNEQLLYIRPNDLRPLKTQQSQRTIPLHPKLLPICKQIIGIGEYPFITFKSGNRWGGGIIWSQRIGIHPHGLRHAFATTLRENDIQELIISTLLGHKPLGQTAAYGSVSMDKLRQAILTLT